jgi:hypothetical protein
MGCFQKLFRNPAGVLNYYLRQVNPPYVRYALACREVSYIQLLSIGVVVITGTT